MNEIVNKFLLAGDKYMTETHLKQPDLLIVLADQFNIVTVLLTIIFQHNFKKLLISLDFFLFSQGYKNYCKIVKEAKKFFLSYFELCGRGTETF